MPTKNANVLVGPLLTDKYQVTMCYVYWKDGRSEDMAVFDIFFRKNPFRGEYTIFCGLEECLKFISNFKYTLEDVEYLKRILSPDLDQNFFDYLLGLDTKLLEVYALKEGTVCFPNIPMMRVEGPLGLVQLLETTLLNLINFPSLVATNAARHRYAADLPRRAKPVQLIEYGLRRAQGPDGGLSASRYSYLGGFEGTSNLMAGKKFGIPVSGTHAHSFILSYHGRELNATKDQKSLLNKKTGDIENFTIACLATENELYDPERKIFNRYNSGRSNNRTELLAFISYAVAFPTSFLALVDTYEVIKSGLINFCIVAITLIKFGYKPIGIRIDSGDLAYNSREAYELFQKIALRFDLLQFKELDIVASNDINEETIYSLNDQGHEITCFGIGTHLVTCQSQPALGCVYKLDQIDGQPCMKLSPGAEKLTIPGKKKVYRLFSQEGFAMIDLIQSSEEDPPKPGRRILCRHPFIADLRSYATPTRVEELLQPWWREGKICQPLASLEESKAYVKSSLKLLRSDILRFLNPTPYKVSVSQNLYEILGQLRLSLAPVGELI